MSLHQFVFFKALAVPEVLAAAILAQEHGHHSLVDLGLVVLNGFGLRPVAPEFAVVPSPSFGEGALFALLVNGN